MTTAATLILAISANISIPIQPIPLSLQSLAVLLIGACLGRKLGCLAVLEYLLLGAAGLPFFAGGHGGIGVLTSVSAGYLYAFNIGYLPFAGFDLVKFLIATVFMFYLWRGTNQQYSSDD